MTHGKNNALFLRAFLYQVLFSVIAELPNGPKGWCDPISQLMRLTVREITEIGMELARWRVTEQSWIAFGFRIHVFLCLTQHLTCHLIFSKPW